MLMIIVLHFVGPYTNLDKSIKNYYLINLMLQRYEKRTIYAKKS